MKKVCGNCKQTYIEGDKYCRFCGAPMGEPSFIQEHFARIYGPKPVTRTHQCTRCSYTWEAVLMIDNERWCPRCGGAAPVVSEED